MGKIESYLGFAVRSGKILYGIDSIKQSRKRKYLLVLSPSASENLCEKADRYSTEFGVPLIRTTENLEDLLNKPNCKLAALLDVNMAKAVTESVGR